MYEPPPGCEVVFRGRERHECLELRLVLEAVGISVEAVHEAGCWLLIVERDDLAVASAELDAYRRENSERSSSSSTAVPVYDGAAAAVLTYVAVVIVVAIFSAHWAWGQDWLSAGRMQAGRVMAGEWWRTVTALTLHLDAGHIISNVVFGGVFGFLAGRILGGGVAWLAIVLAGALGNLVNAMVQAPTHSSIGASTAVFAALGLTVSHALRPRTAVPEKRLKRWSPLIGGTVLLALTGIGGENTDVVAHLTGFLAGLLIGWLGCRLPHRWLASHRTQQWAGFTAITIVVSAWIVGLVIAASRSESG